MVTRIMVDGMRLKVSDVAKIKGVSTSVIYRKLRAGESLENIYNYFNPCKHESTRIEVGGEELSVSNVTKIEGVESSTSNKIITDSSRPKKLTKAKNSSFLYRGKEYTLDKLVRLAHPTLDKKIIMNRVYRGWSVEDAISVPKRGRHINIVKIVVNGMRLSVEDVAKIKGVSTNLIYNRIRKGESLENIYYQEDSLISNGKRVHLYKGKKYSATELEKFAHPTIKRGNILCRVLRGWSVEDAISVPRGVKYSKTEKYEYKGSLMTLHQISMLPECVVSKDVLRGRILDCGWSVNRAVTTPLLRKNYTHKNSHKYQYKGSLMTLRQLSELPECSVSQLTLRYRIKKYGWDVEKSVITPSYSGNRPKKR